MGFIVFFKRSKSETRYTEALPVSGPANRGTRGFPALFDFQQMTEKAIAQRAHEAYSITGANQCSRMRSELSLRSATEEEETAFEERSEQVYRYESYIDRVMNRYQHWNDGIVCNIWTGVKSEDLPLYDLVSRRVPVYGYTSIGSTRRRRRWRGQFLHQALNDMMGTNDNWLLIY